MRRMRPAGRHTLLHACFDKLITMARFACISIELLAPDEAKLAPVLAPRQSLQRAGCDGGDHQSLCFP